MLQAFSRIFDHFVGIRHYRINCFVPISSLMKICGQNLLPPLLSYQNFFIRRFLRLCGKNKESYRKRNLVWKLWGFVKVNNKDTWITVVDFVQVVSIIHFWNATIKYSDVFQGRVEKFSPGFFLLIKHRKGWVWKNKLINCQLENLKSTNIVALLHQFIFM